MFRIAGIGALAGPAALLLGGSAMAGVFAAEVIEYQPGAAVDLFPAYTTSPEAAVGSPARMADDWGVVSPFNPPWQPSDLVIIGEGGSLTLRLANYAMVGDGREIGIFSNIGIEDVSFDYDNWTGNGTAGDPAATLGEIGVAEVRVSEDGQTWVSLGQHVIDVPTLAWRDAGPYSASAGSEPADFGVPFDGSLASFSGQDWGGMLSLLGDSAGGTWIDLSQSGLAQVGFIRFIVADDGDSLTNLRLAIDGISVANGAVGPAVPEPSAVALLIGGGMLMLRRRIGR